MHILVPVLFRLSLSFNYLAVSGGMPSDDRKSLVINTNMNSLVSLPRFINVSFCVHKLSLVIVSTLAIGGIEPRLWHDIKRNGLTKGNNKWCWRFHEEFYFNFFLFPKY